MIDHEQAVEMIERAFPALREDLHDETWDGLLHLQIAQFSHFAQAVIDAGDRPTFTDICTVSLRLISEGSEQVINAMNVSFLEHLNFTDGKRRRSWAYAAMPSRLRNAHEAMSEYNRTLDQRARSTDRRHP